MTNKFYICETCGDQYTDDYTNALGHTGGTATCKDKAVCTRCGEPHGELDATNHAGGIVGGITNGNDIVVRAAIKPTASISSEQQTFNFETGAVEPLVIKGRHDVCITLRAAVVAEAALAIALADLKLRA